MKILGKKSIFESENSQGKYREKIMGKNLFFFMNKDDLINMSVMIEKQIEVVYVANKAYHQADGKSFGTMTDFPNLGLNVSGNHQSEGYIVIEKKSNISWRKVKQRQSENEYRYFVDQAENPDSIVFWPGGFYNKENLICVHIGTISDTVGSKKIFKCFEKSIKKICGEKHGRYYYSENVKNMKNVRLITMNINEPPEYDICLNR